jgi:adenylate kinase
MKALEEILQTEDEIELVSVIEVRVGEAVAKERILGRAAEAEVARSDDSVEVFYDRMKIYNDPLAEIQNFYTDKNLLHVIDGERTLEVIVDEMDDFVQSKTKK